MKLSYKIYYFVTSVPVPLKILNRLFVKSFLDSKPIIINYIILFLYQILKEKRNIFKKYFVLYTYIFRFGMYHPTRTSGLVLLQCSGGLSQTSLLEKLMNALQGPSSNVNENEPQLNHKNIRLYAESYKNRLSCLEEVADRIK